MGHYQKHELYLSDQLVSILADLITRRARKHALRHVVYLAEGARRGVKEPVKVNPCVCEKLFSMARAKLAEESGTTPQSEFEKAKALYEMIIRDSEDPDVMMRAQRELCELLGLGARFKDRGMDDHTGLATKVAEAVNALDEVTDEKA